MGRCNSYRKKLFKRAKEDCVSFSKKFASCIQCGTTQDHWARGLCKTCYGRLRYANPDIRQRQIDNSKRRYRNRVKPEAIAVRRAKEAIERNSELYVIHFENHAKPSTIIARSVAMYAIGQIRRGLKPDECLRTWPFTAKLTSSQLERITHSSNSHLRSGSL